MTKFASGSRTARSIKESVKYCGTGLKKRKINTPILLVTCLLTTLLLAACGAQPLPTNVNTNITPGNVTVTGSPVSTLNQVSPSPALPTMTTLPTPTIVPPTSTAVPTPTLVPTPTAVPTPTIPPSPTPVPLPTSLLLGPEGSEWGQITLYQPTGSDRLEVLPLEGNLQTDLSGWFQYAPMLVNSTNAGKNGNQFLMKIDSQLFKNALNGLPIANSIGTQIRAKSAGSTFIQLTSSSLVKIILRPDTIIGLLDWLSNQLFEPEINKQLDIISNKLDEIKGFLEAKEQAAIQGNLKYLDDLADNLSKASPDAEELKIYLGQLETIERESLQSMILLEGQLKDLTEQVKALTFDKSFLLFRNDDQVKKLNAAVVNFKNKASSYETVLLVRGLAGQIRCALPFKRDTALARLTDVRQELTNWRNNYQLFLEQVDQKIPQMDGLFADNKIQENLKEASRLGKLGATTEYTRFDASFALTIQKVNAQIREANQPLFFVGELDSQGQLKNVSKLIQ